MRLPRRPFLCALLLALTASGFAQATATGSFVGRVTDPTGKEVAGAEVIATNVATRVRRTVDTTSAGYYAIPGLPPGAYQVMVKPPPASVGFSVDLTETTLSVGDAREVDFQLHLTISGSNAWFPALLQPTRTDVSTIVDGLDLRLLPVFAARTGGINDFTLLALITPGMKLDTSNDTSDLIGPGAVNSRYNQYNITSLNITDQLAGGRDGVGASVEEVQQFQLLAANYDAQYGQAGGFLLNAVTKSGANAYHGDGHIYFRGRNLQASNPFYNLALAKAGVPIEGARRAPFHRQEGGFNMGGALIKDRLFWFANFELSHQGVQVVLAPPLGTFILDSPINNFLLSGRLDYRLSDRHTVFVRFAAERFFQDNLNFGGVVTTPDGLTTFSQHEIGVTAGLASTLTPHLVNQAGFSFFRMINDREPKTTQPGQQHLSTFFTGANFQVPRSTLEKRFQFLDNLTWTHGRHTVKAGFDISAYPWTDHEQPFFFGLYSLNALDVPVAFTFAPGPGLAKAHDTLVGLYLQDSWRLTPTLTLNYGLRYDVEAGAFHGGTMPGPSGCVQGNGILPACSSDHNNFQPRVGIAWAPWKHTVVRASFAETTQMALGDLLIGSLISDGVNNQIVRTSNPAVLAAFPNSPSPALLAPLVPPPGPPFGPVFPISSHLRNPELRSFNLAVEHQFGNSMTATVQYLGQYGFGLFGEDDANAPPILPDPAHPGFFFYGNRPDVRFAAVPIISNSRTSHYNGLLVTVNKRFSHRVQLLANYTWSHTLTSADDFFTSAPSLPGVLRPEMASANNDIRHAANFGLVFDSGRFTQSRVGGWFVNDVTLGLLGQLQSARPYNLSTGTVGFLNGFFTAQGGTQERPNVLPDGTISSAGIPSVFGQTAMFGPGAVAACIAAGLPAAQCNSIQNTFIAPAGASPLGPTDALSGDVVDFRQATGNLGRNAAHGAPFYRLDASLQKSFRLPTTEDVRLEFRVDAFNLFNRSNFQGFQFTNLTALRLSLTPLGTPAPDFFTCTRCLRPSGAYIGSAGQVLNIQTLNGRVSPNLLSPTFNGVGDPRTADIARTLQLSVRVRF